MKDEGGAFVWGMREHLLVNPTPSTCRWDNKQVPLCLAINVWGQHFLPCPRCHSSKGNCYCLLLILFLLNWDFGSRQFGMVEKVMISFISWLFTYDPIWSDFLFLHLSWYLCIHYIISFPTFVEWLICWVLSLLHGGEDRDGQEGGWMCELSTWLSSLGQWRVSDAQKPMLTCSWLCCLPGFLHSTPK